MRTKLQNASASINNDPLRGLAEFYGISLDYFRCDTLEQCYGMLIEAHAP